MAGQQPPDQPSPDPTEGTGPTPPTEADLDDVLVKASLLAEELSEEVGAPDEPHSAPDASETPSETAAVTDIDAELQELERLVASTSEQFRESDEPDALAPVPPPDQQSVDQEAERNSPNSAAGPTYPNGDFDDFSDLRAPPAPSAQTLPAPGGSSDPAGPAESEDPSRETGTTKMKDSAAAEAGSTGHVTATGTSLAANEPDLISRVLSFLRRIASRLSPLALAVCTRIISSLEVVDRPFDRIGDTVRRLIGWIAIATIGTATLVFLYSLF